jgi:orotate phosphoribosyltransferase
MSVEVERIFREAGALLEGHFLLSSGKHSPVYWEKFLVLQYPGYTEKLCRLISEHFQEQGIQVVAGPTTGGIILAYEVARQLGVRGIFAESEVEKTLGGERRIFRRGFSIMPGERTLVVDDVLTTGGSIQETIAAVKGQGGKVTGVGVLVDRSPKEIDFGVPLFSCYRTSVPTYAPEDCPLCAAKIPLVEPGGG